MRKAARPPRRRDADSGSQNGRHANLVLPPSVALTDGGATALHTLESSRQPLPESVLDVCDAFIAAHKNDIGDISTGAAGDVMYVVRLALRMHAQYIDPQIRHRCLNLIDQLVVHRAHNIESDLDTIER